MASVPDTDAESATAPFAVPLQVQLNETEAAAATSCAAGVGPETTWAVPVPLIDSDGVSAFTPTPPPSVTTSVIPKTSPPRTAEGADSVADTADGVTNAIGLEATDPAAAYDDYVRRVCDVVGYAHPRGVAVEAELGELPAGVAGFGHGKGETTDPEGAPLNDPDPEIVVTSAGSGTGATLFASASPELLTPRVAVKVSPAVTVEGIVSQRAESCAAACTNTIGHTACAATGAADIAS